MKILTIALATLLPLTASAAFEEKVECEITKINGNFSSFMPPQIGSRFTIDTREESLPAIQFTDDRMIPLYAPLTKVAPSHWSDHLATYESKVNGDEEFEDTVLIQVGRFSGGTIAATIQRLGQTARDQLWFIEEAHARCEIKP